MARPPGGSSRRGAGGPRLGRLDPTTRTAPRPPQAEAGANPIASDPNLVQLGEFGRAHGLNGEVRLKSYTGDPRAIAGYGPLIAADGRPIELVDARIAPGPAPDLLVVRVKGVGDRTGAEALNRLGLYVPRERLGEAGDEDEFLTVDLVGLAVVDGAGNAIGTVVDAPNYGGGDLLEIRPAEGGATALLPFTKAFVPAVDIAAGRITIDPPDDLFAPAGPKPADEPG